MGGGERELYDITIIGGGPAGLFAAFYAGLRGMRTRIIDSLDQLGGQLSALYPEKFIYDVAGFPAVLARTLVTELIKQALQYEPTIVLNEEVRTLRAAQDGTLELASGDVVHRSRTVLVTVGAGAFAPKKLPGPAFGQYEGRGLSYFVRDISEYRGRRLLVIGGGDSAVDWALQLSRVAEQVTLIHRRDRFRAHEDSVVKLMASKVDVRTFRELKEIGGRDRIEWAVIADTRTGAEERLDVDAVLVNIGFTSSLGALREWGLNMDGEGIVVNTRMETNVPGVYAAGDVVSYPGKLKLIATGFGEAATAVNHAKVFIDPASKYFPGHSTTIVPKQRKAAES